MDPTFIIKAGENQYPVIVKRKKIMKRILFRYQEENKCFLVSAPYFASTKEISNGLEKFAPKMLEKAAQEKKSEDIDGIYIFGEKRSLEEFSNLDEDKRDKYLKNLLLGYLLLRVPEIEKEMSITDAYKIAVRDMSTRYGVNSKRTHKVTFALQLVHFSKPTIDGVIYHEMAHHYHFDHQAGFYELLKKHSPDYKNLRKRLREKDYESK